MTEPRYPSQLAERFQIRMPDGLRDRLRDAAEANNRSMNAEIVHRLEDTFDPNYDTDALNAAYNEGRKDALAKMGLEPDFVIEAGRAPFDGSGRPVLHILLDANGMPTNISEIMLHIGQLMVKTGLSANRIDVTVYDPAEAAGDKLDAYFDKVQRWRELFKSGELPSPSSIGDHSKEKPE